MISSSTPIFGNQNPLKQSLAAANMAQGPAIPWRKSNVRHTSNELYVDIIESMSVTIAPSGRLLSALVLGTIAFTAELSGVPDLNLSLTTVGGRQAIAQRVKLPVFHPCVRLARWREYPGELNFVPPDGGFVLAGYEVDLLPTEPDADKPPPSRMEEIFLPATVDIRKSLGPVGSDFEVRLTLNTDFPGFPSAAASRSAARSSPTPSSFLGGGGGNSSSLGPSLEEVVVSIPISKAVRNITEMQASRGDIQYSPGSDVLEWRVPTKAKDAGSISGVATLRCSVAGYHNTSTMNDDDIEMSDREANENLLQGYYQEADNMVEPRKHETKKKKKKKKEKTTTSTTSKKSRPTAVATAEDLGLGSAAATTASGSGSPPPSPSKRQTPTPSIFRPAGRKSKAQLNAGLMPTSASVSFVVRGWLPSGIKVDSLTIDTRRSRGLGEGVRPFKGVKYLCVSQRGIERRC